MLPIEASAGERHAITRVLDEMSEYSSPSSPAESASSSAPSSLEVPASWRSAASEKAGDEAGIVASAHSKHDRHS
eukprot:14565216-Alexandrium_andersonii.AAC.1